MESCGGHAFISAAAQGEMMIRWSHLVGLFWPGSTSLGAPCMPATVKLISRVLESGSVRVSLRTRE